ncbi:MAG TPA: ribosome biogenesis GTP-binding protein YihA/YsxC [Burkholderiales bacterium]|nr:ribosome biogenesis GTP-binding protein YihA/YsxC [Burkholderiales bacterium]
MSAFSQATFTASVGNPDQLLAEGPPEVVFAGRSNVGKSSAINALTGRRRLAFVSKTPGRTQTINFYDLGATGRLVDLPGYGYARVPRAVRTQWDQLVGGYLSRRASLAAAVLVMDARHPFTPQDVALLKWLAPLGLRLLVLLSKCDKLSRSQRVAALSAGRRQLAAFTPDGEVRLLSSLTHEGVAEVRTLLEEWLRDAGRAAENKKAPGKGDINRGRKRLNQN